MKIQSLLKAKTIAVPGGFLPVVLQEKKDTPRSILLLKFKYVFRADQFSNRNIRKA